MREFDDARTLLPASTRDDRLNSWKEIAAYLGRDTRTAQRWERREGLPVRRHVHERNATVYALKSEIDAWQVRRAPEPSDAVPAAPVPAGASFAARLVRRLGKGGWLGVAAIASALALVGLYAASLRPSRRLAALAYDSGSLHGRDGGGTTLWSLSLPKLTACAHGWSGHLVDMDGDGGTEVLTATWASLSPGRVPDIRPGALYCLAADGTLRWQAAPEDKLSFGEKRFGPMWTINQWEVFDAAAQPTRVALTAHDWMWWPSMLAVLDGQGQVLGKFVNSGWLLSLYRWQRPAGAVFFVGGVSNSRDAGIMAVLDAENVSGRSPEEPGSEYECATCPPGRPLRYFVFPRSELNLATGSQQNGVTAFNVLEGRVLVYTIEVPESVSGTGYIDAIYEFSSDLQLQRAFFHDRYWDLHRRLEAAGTLKHARAACPDRDGPTRIRAWDPQQGWRDLHPAAASSTSTSAARPARP